MVGKKKNSTCHEKDVALLFYTSKMVALTAPVGYTLTTYYRISDIVIKIENRTSRNNGELQEGGRMI